MRLSTRAFATTLTAGVASLFAPNHACDPDADGDGIPNAMDPCPLSASNVRGSPGCDADSDGDGVPDSIDNCLDVRNFDQGDMDHDGVGDVCDGDIDGDQIANP